MVKEHIVDAFVEYLAEGFLLEDREFIVEDRIDVSTGVQELEVIERTVDCDKCRINVYDPATDTYYIGELHVFSKNSKCNGILYTYMPDDEKVVYVCNVKQIVNDKGKTIYKSVQIDKQSLITPETCYMS